MSPYLDPELRREKSREAQQALYRERTGYHTKMKARKNFYSSIPEYFLQSLLPSDRMILKGYYVDGLSCAAIGRQLGCSRAHVARQLKKLVSQIN